MHDGFLIFSFFNTKVHYADDTFVFVSHVYLQSRTLINSVILLLLLKGETTVI